MSPFFFVLICLIHSVVLLFCNAGGRVVANKIFFHGEPGIVEGGYDVHTTISVKSFFFLSFQTTVDLFPGCCDYERRA